MALVKVKVNPSMRTDAVNLPNGSGGWSVFEARTVYEVSDTFLDWEDSNGLPYLVNVTGEENFMDLSVEHPVNWYEGEGAVNGTLGRDGDRYVETDSAGNIVAFWRREGGVWGDRQLYGSGGGGGGVTDHGALTGLTDDDHAQYFNQTRGDARYYTKTLSDGRYVRTVNSVGPDVTGNVTVSGGSGGTSITGYTVTNGTPDRTFDASNATVDELANVLAALIADLS